jgi:hypothetical protein
MVEIFKTNIADKVTAEVVLRQIQVTFPTARINFDLEDRENILRIEDLCVSVPDVIRVATSLGYHCEVLG